MGREVSPSYGGERERARRERDLVELGVRSRWVIGRQMGVVGHSFLYYFVPFASVLWHNLFKIEDAFWYLQVA